jgi:hypothetical protein
MDFLFLFLLVVMLAVFGYALLQKDVIKTPGHISLSEEEEIKLR